MGKEAWEEGRPHLSRIGTGYAHDEVRSTSIWAVAVDAQAAATRRDLTSEGAIVKLADGVENGWSYSFFVFDD